MTIVDHERIERLQERMKAENLAALVCRLPENVVYLTDNWPHLGVTFAVMPQEGKPLLFVPQVEQEYANLDWSEVVVFSWGLLEDAPVYDTYHRLLEAVSHKLGLRGRRVGVEQGFETVAPTYRSAEPLVPARPWMEALASGLPEAVLVDATRFLERVRAVKSAYEVEKLRITNQIAENALQKALAALEPGMTEAQLGAQVEFLIRSDGPGYREARLARASCEVNAGPANSLRGSLLVPSTGYVIQPGDLVMLELGTVVDGYWSDLTYMAAAGGPSQRQIEVHNHVLRAQQLAAAQLCPGNSFSDPDRAARDYLTAAGLGSFFIHGTGHGIGLRYHEAIPALGPDSPGVLEQGMVTSVEPGVYIPGFGGMRLEDNVLVGPEGPLFLSTPRQPW